MLVFIIKLDRPVDGVPPGDAAKKSAVACPIHVSTSHTKFGWISSNGLGDSITDRRTEAITIPPPPHPFFKKCGDNKTVCSDKSNTPRTLVKLIFLFFNQNLCCGYSKEPSQIVVC